MSLPKMPWYQSSFRRCLIDMHIPDWDERFLSELDPQAYVDLMTLARVDTAMIYADSCLGICYWPTPIGHMHRGIQGRDVLGEIVAGCRERGINAIVYYNFWSKWAYDSYPEWRFISAEGKGTADYLWTKGRYGVCCFNTPYRGFMLAQIEDLCDRYAFDGMWIDMIFWPYSPCHCSCCKQRYREETGAELPLKADWTEAGWVRFQRTREAWLAEFIGELAAVVRRKRPEASFGHQFSAWSTGWRTGMTNAAFRNSDYASGDFYGDALHQSFTCKALYELSENKPFEFMTSRCPDLSDHTTTKPAELLRAQMFFALAHQGSFLFIDAIDPSGTLDRRVYEMMGRLYEELEPFEPFLDHNAEFCYDAAIYINFESAIEAYDGEDSYMNRATSAAKSLSDANIPYGVLTKKNLRQLAQCQIVILPNVLMLDQEETEAFTRYVQNGGSLYASKHTSLMNKDGVRLENFQLSELFGVSWKGETEETVTYIAPSPDSTCSLQPFNAAYPAMLRGTQLLVEPSENTRLEATITLPYVNPQRVDAFASAISNPPGKPTSWPAITRRRCGQGQVVYAAGDIESSPHQGQRELFASLIRSLRSKPFHYESDAPKCVEITLFHDAHLNRYRLHLLNFQQQLPNIPVHGIGVHLHIGAKRPLLLRTVPDGQPIGFTSENGMVSFTVPKLDTFLMLLLEYSTETGTIPEAAAIAQSPPSDDAAP